jgi:hypothetical protein
MIAISPIIRLATGMGPRLIGNPSMKAASVSRTQTHAHGTTSLFIPEFAMMRSGAM